MKQINISGDHAMVTCSPANIDVTETVFFSNLDTDPDPAKATHWRRREPEPLKVEPDRSTLTS